MSPNLTPLESSKSVTVIGGYDIEQSHRRTSERRARPDARPDEPAERSVDPDVPIEFVAVLGED